MDLFGLESPDIQTSYQLWARYVAVSSVAYFKPVCTCWRAIKVTEFIIPLKHFIKVQLKINFATFCRCHGMDSSQRAVEEIY